MFAFAILFLSACTNPWSSVDTTKSWNTQVHNENTQKSIKEQIAERNGVKENTKNGDEQWKEAKEEEQKQENIVKKVEDEDIDALASCLTEKGLKMFGTARCSHCKNQKAMFGSSFEKINFTDCDEEKQTCTDAGIQWYPTWTNAEGKLFPGAQSLEQLATLAGCAY